MPKIEWAEFKRRKYFPEETEFFSKEPEKDILESAPCAPSTNATRHIRSSLPLRRAKVVERSVDRVELIILELKSHLAVFSLIFECFMAKTENTPVTIIQKHIVRYRPEDL